MEKPKADSIASFHDTFLGYVLCEIHPECLAHKKELTEAARWALEQVILEIEKEMK